VEFWVRDDSLVCFAKAREGRFLVLQEDGDGSGGFVSAGIKS